MILLSGFPGPPESVEPEEKDSAYIYIFNLFIDLFIYLFYHDWLSNLCLLSVQEVMDTNAVPEAREARAHTYIYIYIFA